MTRYPRLLDADMREIETLTPIAYQLKDKLTPLSMAYITLPPAQTAEPRAFVALHTAEGSAGIYRISNVSVDPGGVTELTLQHGLCTLSDHMHPGQSSESGSCRMLLTKLLANQTRWALGTVDVPEDQDLKWECDNTNDLQGLLSILQELPGYYLETDQTAMPWLLHVLAKPTEIECEARIDRNVDKVQIDYDCTEMCTLAYADGLDEPIEADTIGIWGRIARHVTADAELGAEYITQAVERYLEKSKNPRITITITAQELSRITGEPFDSFRKGKLCRCILPDMTVVQRIEDIDRPDPIGEPTNVVLTLASTQSDMSVTVAGLVVDTRHANQLIRHLEKNLRVEAETIDMIAQEITLLATRTEVDGVSARITQAELSLNDAFGQIALKVAYTDFETAMNEVSLELDAVNNTLAAKADLILLDGYVRMEDFEAVQGWATDFAGVTVSASNFVGGYGDFDECWCGQLNGGTPATKEWVKEQLAALGS